MRCHQPFGHRQGVGPSPCCRRFPDLRIVVEGFAPCSASRYRRCGVAVLYPRRRLRQCEENTANCSVRALRFRRCMNSKPPSHDSSASSRWLRYDAVLLDIDGTLVDSNGAHAAAWSDAFAAHGRHHSPEEIRPLIGKGGDKLLRELASLDHESGQGQKISEERAEIFRTCYLPNLQPTPGAPAFVEWLLGSHLKGRRRHIREAGGAAGPPEDLRRTGVGEGRDDVGRCRPVQA